MSLWFETQRPFGFVGGAIVGIFVGAIKGQTTETGFLNGAGIGAVTGALAAIQLLESAADCESLSKVMLYVQYVKSPLISKVEADKEWI